jgi:hypothetical protein
MIIKPQDALFSELCFQYSIFCLRKKQEAKKNQAEASQQNRQNTYSERLSGILKAFGIRQEEVGIMDKALMQRGCQGF